MGVNKGRRFVAGGGGGGCLINGNKGRKCVTRILLDSSSISYFSLLLVLILVIISDQGVSHQKTSSALATAAVAASSSVSSGGTTTRQRWLQYQTALSNTGPLGSSSSSSSAPPTATTSSTTTTSHPILNPNNENISMTSSPPSGSTSAPTTKPLTTTKSFSSRSSSSNINSYNSNRNNYFGAAGRRRMPNPTYVDGFPDGALFENNTSVNITVPLGDTAFLRCRVKNLGERSISWVRRRDWHILTTGKVTYTNDERFHILHTEGTDDWTLQIKFIQSRDNGTYECQISTGTGIISFLVNVMIAVPEAFILGNGDEYHVEQGSTINLVCVIEKSPKVPEFIFWYHNELMINYGSSREVTVRTEPGLRTQSRLTIRDARISDSGNYSCKTPHAEPASIFVYVSQASGLFSGDKIAAIQRRTNNNSPSSATSSGSSGPTTLSSTSLLRRVHLFEERRKSFFCSRLTISAIIITIPLLLYPDLE